MPVKELSLHIMDLAQNSISAGASLLELTVEENHANDFLRIELKDNGCGMEKEFLQRVVSPFTTKRTTRSVGLGIPMFKEGAERTGGSFMIESQPGVGTRIGAKYVLSSIDRQPMGDLAGTVLMLVISNPNMDFVLTVTVNAESYRFDTREIREILGAEVPLDNPDVSIWMQENLKEGISALHGGM